MRKQGLPYREILQHVRVSQSSLSLWLRGIQLQEHQRRRINAKAGRLQGGNATRASWEARRREIASSYVPPLHNPSFMLGLGLYLGEGIKYSPSDVGLGNTDPALLRVFIAWLRQFFPEDLVRLAVEVHHHRGPGEDEAVKAYWSEKLGIPVECFMTCFHIKPRSAKEAEVKGYGLACVRVRGRGTWKIRQKIQVAIDRVKGSIA